MEYNIYCDESCHLYYDTSDFLILGAIQCPKLIRKSVCEDIKNIKKKHHLDPSFEIKWTKVGIGKVEFYQELVDYFFLQNNLKFKCLVVGDKQKLTKSLQKDLNKINEAYNLWYYTGYYALLDGLINPSNNYNIYMDIKDTKGGQRIHQLHTVLCNNVYDYKKNVIKKIQLIRSNESEILQLTDLLIGAIGYYNRFKDIIDAGTYYEDYNKGKVHIIEHLKQISGLTLSGTAKQNNFEIVFLKFNVEEQ